MTTPSVHRAPTSSTSPSSAAASSGAAIARELAGTDGRRRARRGARRRRRRHQQGQHRHPAHRLRRHAGHARVAAGRAAATTCWAPTPQRTGIPVERTGALLVAWTDEELAALPGLQAKAEANGYRALRARRRRRGLRRGCRASAPGALGRPHRARRVDHLHLDHHPRPRHRRRAAAAPSCCLGHRVDGGARARPTTRCCTPTAARSAARWVVNAAGLGADVVDRLFGHDRFTVTPRRGELLVFDKLARPLVPTRSCCRCPSQVARACWSAPPSTATSCSARPPRTSTDRTATGTSEAGLRVPARQGPRADARPARGGGHRDVRRPARGHRPRRLPASTSTPRSATCWSAASAPPGSRRRWRSPSTSWSCSPRPGSTSADRDDLPPPPRMPQPRRGRSRGRTRTPTGSPPTRRTARSSASASGSPPARSATPSPRRLPPADLDGLRRRTRAHERPLPGLLLRRRGRAPLLARAPAGRR